MTNEFPDVIFLSVDPRELKSVAAKYGVWDYLIYVMFKDGQKVDEAMGGDSELRYLLEDHGFPPRGMPNTFQSDAIAPSAGLSAASSSSTGGVPAVGVTALGVLLAAIGVW